MRLELDKLDVNNSIVSFITFFVILFLLVQVSVDFQKNCVPLVSQVKVIFPRQGNPEHKKQRQVKQYPAHYEPIVNLHFFNHISKL